MNKIIFKRPDKFGIGILNFGPKEEFENETGQTLTDEEYKNRIMKDLPPDAINPRFIKDEDMPNDLYFIDAWDDIPPSSRIDIDCTKAKEIQLGIMREERQKKFVELGIPTQLHPELEASILSPETRTKLQELRNCTESLKALDTAGKYNDEDLLNEIKRLGSF